MTRSTEKGDTKIPSPEEYVKMHQKAFRTAFDFLTRNFPPGENPEWWLAVTKDASESSALAGENALVIRLLSAVCNYLEYEYFLRRDNDETDNQ